MSMTSFTKISTCGCVMPPWHVSVATMPLTFYKKHAIKNFNQIIKIYIHVELFFTVMVPEPARERGKT